MSVAPPGSPPHTARRGSPMRDAILQAARRRFQRFGVPKTTLEEVAREAGCSRTTLYAHFRNKRDLYAQLLEQDAEAFIRDASRVLEGRGRATGKIRRIVELTRRTYARNHVMRLAAEADAEMSLVPVAQGFTRSQERRIVALLERVLEQGVEEGSLRPIDTGKVAYLMFHLGRLLVARETAGVADHPFDAIVSVMDDVFAHGITSSRAGRR